MNQRDLRELQIRRDHAQLSRTLLVMCRGLGSRTAELTDDARKALLHWANVLEGELQEIKQELGDG